MLLGEILRIIDDTDGNTVSFYDRMGYINPERVRVGKVERRIYSERDFEMIKRIWKYHKQGYSPRVAYRKALNELKETEKNLDRKLGDLLKRAEKREISLAALMKSPDMLSSSDVKKDLIRILRHLLQEE